jgi:transposase
VSGRAILQALIDGEDDPDKLLTLVQRGVKAPPERLRAALQGRVSERHRFLLRLHLRQVDALDAAVAEIDAEVNRDLDPFRQAVRQLRTIPGVSDLTAQVIVSEIGIDMNRFPTAGHLISWAGLCPRNDESAGKRRSTRLRKGAPWLKTTLVQCAWAASRKKASYLQAQFQRLRHRRGPKKAICAVAASILTAAYHMLRDGTFYHDIGADHFHRASPEAQANRLARQIAKLGFTCSLSPAPPGPVSV